MAQERSLAWDLFVIGFKITFVSAGVGLIVANLKDGAPPSLLVMPAFAAIFFDLLIHSYSYSIKRTGYYCRTRLEPVIRTEDGCPTELWEGFMASKKAGRNVAFWGNLGITLLTVVLGVIGLFVCPLRPLVSVPLCICLAALLPYDIWTFYKPRRFSKNAKGQSN